MKPIYVLFHDKDKTKKLKIYQEINEPEFKQLNSDGWGVYFSVNLFNNGRRRKEDCAKLRYIFADLDIAKEGDGSTEQQRTNKKQKVISALYEKIIPTLIIDTKNGIQPLWKLEDGTIDKIPEYENVIKGLIEWSKTIGCAGDAVQDCARILRLPGYLHQKGEPYLCEEKYKTDKSYKLEDIKKVFYKEEKKYEPVKNNYPLNDVAQAVENIDIKELVIRAFQSVGRTAEFNNNQELVLDGRKTGTFQGRKDGGNFIASSSHEPFKGNRTTVVADILGVTNKEAYRWIIKEYDLNFDEIEKKKKIDSQLSTIKSKDNILSIDKKEKRYTWGTYRLDNEIAILKRGNLVVLGAKRNMGKCLGLGTKIIMFDGTLKKVEDIVVGDKIMGDDSTPRNVLSLARGKEPMYLIKQKGGINYRVNESHILSLEFSGIGNKKFKDGLIKDMSVCEYLKLNKTLRLRFKGYKVPFNFKEKKVTIDPYFLGVWLGDGHSRNVRVTISERKKNIQKFIYDYAEKLGLQVSYQEEKGKCSTFGITTGSRGQQLNKKSLQKNLNSLGVLNNKHIPLVYLANSKENRLKLLAGLLDTDGYCSGCSFEITQKSELLARNIKFLADSLGFKTSIKRKKCCIKKISFVGYYWRVRIFGDVSITPCKEHTIKKWTSSRNGKRSGLTIEKDTIDNYYGFEIDGNGRFLLEDGTVTHNTTFSFDMAVKNAKLGHRVLYISLEMEKREIIEALARKYANVTIPEEREYRIPPDKRGKMIKIINEINNLPNLIFEGARRAEGVILETVKKIMDDNKADMVFIDNLDCINGNKGEDNNERQKKIVNLLMNYTSVKNIPIILIHHYRKGNKNTSGMDEMAGSGKVADGADIIINLSRRSIEEAKADNIQFPETNKTVLWVQKGRGYDDKAMEIYFINGTFKDYDEITEDEKHRGQIKDLINK